MENFTFSAEDYWKLDPRYRQELLQRVPLPSLNLSFRLGRTAIFASRVIRPLMSWYMRVLWRSGRPMALMRQPIRRSWRACVPWGRYCPTGKPYKMRCRKANFCNVFLRARDIFLPFLRAGMAISSGDAGHGRRFSAGNTGQRKGNLVR